MGGLLMDTCQLCGKHEDERNTQEQMGYTICLGCDGLYSDEELQDKMEQSMNINKLEIGNKVQFAKDTYAMVTNYELDVSHLKGTITHIDNECIHIRTDLDIKDFEDWDYEIYFDLTSDQSCGGTSIDYLKKAKLINMEQSS
jgi:hypothetical protein